MEGNGHAQSLQAELSLSQKWKETCQISPYSLNRASPRGGRIRSSSVPTAPTEPLQEVEVDGPAQSLQAEPSLSQKWKETGQLSPHSPNRASPRSGRRRDSSVPTGETEPLQEVEGDGPSQSLQADRASPRSGRRRASSVPTAPTEPLQEVEGDGPAQSLQAEPRISKKWKETGQLSPYRRNRASPRSGRRRASSVLTGGPSLTKNWKETGQLSPYSLNLAFPRSGRRRASSVPTAPTEPLQEVEGDGPAQSLQAEPRISKKWKETGQLRPYRRNRASPRSGRRRASSVPTAPTEPLQEVEGDGPAQSLLPEPRNSKKWNETGQLSPYRRNRASPRSGRRRAISVLTGGPSLSKKWKETGQLSPHSPNRASPRSGRRRASSVLTGGTEPLQEVEGDGPALSPLPQQSLSKKWKETGQLSPYRRSRESPRSGTRRASSVPAGETEPLQEVEGDGPSQSLQADRASPRSGRRRASSVPTAPTEPLQEVEGDGPAQSLQAEPRISKKRNETGQLSPYRRNRASPRSGRRRASSVPTDPTEPLQEVEGDGPAQSLLAEPRNSKKWKKTVQLSPYRRNRAFQEVEGDGPAQSLPPQPSLSKKWKETGQLSPYSLNLASPRSGRRRASSVPTAPTEHLQDVLETGQLSHYRRNRASPRSGKRRASSVPTGGTEPLLEVEGTDQLNSYRLNRASPRSGRRRASSVPLAPTEPFPEVEGDRPAQSLQPQ